MCICNQMSPESSRPLGLSDSLLLPCCTGAGGSGGLGVGFEFKPCPFGKKGRGVIRTVGQPLRRRGGSIPTGRLVRSPRASQRLHPRLDPAEERSCPSEGLQVIPRFALTPSPSPEADSPITRGFLLPGHRELQSPPTSN